MALLADDLISPLGEIQQSMFPSDTLTDGSTGVVDVLLTKAATLTDDEAKQEAFVYWKAYRAVANRFASELINEVRNKVERSRSDEQLKYWQAKAFEWQAKYEGNGSVLPAVSANVEALVVW